MVAKTQFLRQVDKQLIISSLSIFHLKSISLVAFKQPSFNLDRAAVQLGSRCRSTWIALPFNLDRTAVQLGSHCHLCGMAVPFKLDDGILSLIFTSRALFSTGPSLFSLLFHAIAIVLSFYFSSIFFKHGNCLRPRFLLF